MDLEGKIIIDLGETSGVSKAGNPWKKHEWVIETMDQYPKKVKFHLFGDRADTYRLETGRDYIISFDLESREFNGRWYTDVNVFRVQPKEMASAGGSTFGGGQTAGINEPGNPYGAAPFNPDATPDNSFLAGDEDEQLPF